MLRLTATWADSWNTAWYSEPNDKLAAEIEAFEQALIEMGRPRDEVTRTLGIVVGDESEDTIARRLETWAEFGVDHVIAQVGQPPDVAPITPESVERLGSGARLFRGA